MKTNCNWNKPSLSNYLLSKPIRKIYMKLNYSRSKTINRKTTTNYHLRDEDPLVIICRHISIEDESHRLPVYNCTLKICLTLPVIDQLLVYEFGCLSLKIVKLAFHWRWIFVFVASWRVTATLMALLWSSSAWSLRRYQSNSTQEYGFFPFLARL